MQERVFLVHILIFVLFFNSVKGQIIKNEFQNTSIRLTAGATPVTDINTYFYVVGVTRDPNALRGMGVISGKWWVLTSGQLANEVITSILTNDYYVRSDKIDISSTGTSYRRRVTEAIIHPSYNSPKKQNNIGLIKVCPYFQDNRVAPMAQAAPVAQNQGGVVLGWGFTSLKILRYLNQVVDSDANCATTSAAVVGALPYEIANNFCVLVNADGASTGDVGSPFISNGKVVGIMDTFKGATTGADTYTELTTTFMAWINTESAKV